MIMKQRIMDLENFIVTMRGSLMSAIRMIDLLDHVKPGDGMEYVIPLQFGLHMKCKIMENPFILEARNDILIEKDVDFMKKFYDEQVRLLNTHIANMTGELHQLSEAVMRIEASYRNAAVPNAQK